MATARPVELPQALHRLPVNPSEALQPRLSIGVTTVGSKSVRFYWCRVCNRCLAHWRSAFCTQHRDDYKRMRRRLREGTTGAVLLERASVQRLVDTAHALLYADVRARQATEDERINLAREARNLRERLLQVIESDFARHV